MTSTEMHPSPPAREATGTNDGCGYYQLAGRHDARLTEVGRGTPMGELMRRYWHPVGLSSDARDLPRQIRVLGEDLILFRDRKGRPGLVYPRCCHRGTSLLYGRVENEGIRCCYHGWLYDREGHCLEQPAEPDSPVRRAKARQPWYPVQERYGLVWAYLGPTEKRPLLPRYDVFEELQEGEFVYADDQNIGAVVSGVVPFNWLQHYENIHDPAHFYWLHYLHSGPQFGSRFGDVDLDTIRRELRMRVQGQSYEANERGITARRQVVLPDGRTLTTVLESVLPTLRVVPNPLGTEGPVDHVGFVLPVDDTGFRIYTVVRARDHRFSEFFGKRQASSEARTLEERQRKPGDLEAQGGQGPITLHSEEHLATSDRGIVMLRHLLETQLKIVEAGGDPIGVHFEEEHAYVRLAGGSFISESATAIDS